MKRYMAAILTILALSLCCACNAVTPGPCTTRKMAGVGTAPAAEVMEETEVPTEAEIPTEPVTEAPTEPETKEMPEGKLMRTTADLSIRTGPSTDYDAIGEIPEGGTVLVLDDSESWSVVYYEGERYYMATRYLEDAQ